MAKDEIAIPPQMPAMMPSRLDEIAKSDPDRAFISIPADPKDVSKGYRDISFSAMAIAINRLCAFLEPIIGCNESGSTSAVAYVGVIDPRPIVVLLALQKLGHTVLMTAPRNSVPMHLHIMATTDCKTLLHAEQIDPVTVVGSDDAGIEAVQIPSMDELFSDAAEESRAKNYDFNKPFEECRNDAIMILHTSGSTGMPKSVKIKHDHISVCATLQHMEPVAIPNSTGTPTTYEFLPTFAAKKRRCYVGFPPWHMGGLAAFTTMLAIFGEVTPVFSSWMTPPTGAAMMAAIKYGKVQAAFVPPAPMIELAGSEEGLEALSKLDFVFYGGGALPKPVGDKIAAVTLLQVFIGSTECFYQGLQLIHSSEERGTLWNYFHFYPLDSGFEMREVASSDGAGVYEQTFVRDKKIDHLHAVWKTFPDATEYKTKDLFSRHPDPKLADWWQFESRTDDLIAFANAGKYNPLRYEDQILSNPLVKAALMIGVQRPCAALLVEMAEDIPSDTESAAYQDLLEKVWVTVEDANREAPKHAFVAKDMILLASNDKPFERAGKGTVIRGRTLKKYEEETDGLYRKKGMGMEKTYGHPAV